MTSDIEQFSFNTSISAFMIAVNELTSQKSTNRRAMETVTRLTAPFAPTSQRNSGTVSATMEAWQTPNGRLSMNPPWWRTL